MSAGMAYEAMNNAGTSKTKIIVILNDNDMSIAKPVGAMRSYLAKLLSGKIYFSFRETVKLIISAFSKRFSKKAGKAEDFLRSAFTGGTLFNSLGFYYIGPIDGHDMDSLVSVLNFPALTFSSAALEIGLFIFNSIIILHLEICHVLQRPSSQIHQLLEFQTFWLLLLY